MLEIGYVSAELVELLEVAGVEDRVGKGEGGFMGLGLVVAERVFVG